MMPMSLHVRQGVWRYGIVGIYRYSRYVRMHAAAHARIYTCMYVRTWMCICMSIVFVNDLCRYVFLSLEYVSRVWFKVSFKGIIRLCFVKHITAFGGMFPVYVSHQSNMQAILQVLCGLVKKHP